MSEEYKQQVQEYKRKGEFYTKVKEALMKNANMTEVEISVFPNGDIHVGPYWRANTQMDIVPYKARRIIKRMFKLPPDVKVWIMDAQDPR